MLRSPLNRSGSLSPRRTRKCAVKGCANRFQPRNMGHKVCGPECAAVHAAAERKRLDAKQTRERKAAMKTRTDWLKDAQTSFNRYIRLRAIRWEHACISSGTKLPIDGLGGSFDCGHYRSVGSAPHLRFNMNNAWGQSKQDNRYGAGAAVEYRKGLIARRGIEVVEALESDNTPRKFTVEYLKRIKKIFDKKARRIEKCIR